MVAIRIFDRVAEEHLRGQFDESGRMVGLRLYGRPHALDYCCGRQLQVVFGTFDMSCSVYMGWDTGQAWETGPPPDTGDVGRIRAPGPPATTDPTPAPWDEPPTCDIAP